jgi:O-antigen biosynthesis protein
MSDAQARAATVVLEASAPPCIDWGAADVWRVIVSAGGVPCAAYWVPGPGRLRDPEAFTNRLIQTGRERLEYEASLESFRRRLGIPKMHPAELSCSVVVCTHRRSAYLPGLLDAVTRLDPAPAEVIIVDNDPGERDCRAEVEAAGARYVREDRRGLDNARNAGLRAARGDLVAFTDDDCIPSPRWLASLCEVFAEPSVGAVTGPAFAYELISPAQIQFEREGGFGRGPLRRHWWDWTTLSPPDAAKAGAGANMVFRREALDGLGVVFPPELDAGTPTESGGDLYALYKTLAAGWRVVYDPGTYVFHRHRPDPDALHRAFFGYGVGLSATLAKVLVEDREPDAVHAWWWLVRQYRTAQRERLLGRADGAHVRVAWDYLRGGLHGPRALLRAKVASGDTRPTDDARLEQGGRPTPGVSDAAPRARPTEAPVLSVIVPTAGRHGALARCLGALAAQDIDAPFDVVVIDDARTPQAPTPPASGAATVIRTGGRGAAAARNAGARAAAGDVLLFLDDDLVPAPDLLSRHLAHHDGEPDRVVLGRCPPCPPARSLTDLAAALWWEDRYRDMERSASLTFTDVLSGNMSIRRAPFLTLGGFDEALGTLRREDWHWGVKVLQAGMTVEFEPDAVARHEFVLTAARRLSAAFAEGRGDALLIEKHPEFVHALVTVDSTRPWRTKRTALRLALRGDRSRRSVAAIL